MCNRYKYVHEVLFLVIVNVNVTKYMPQKWQKYRICRYQMCSFKHCIYHNPFSATPGPMQLGELTTGAYDALTDSLVGWGGEHPYPPPRRLPRLDRARVYSEPPSKQNFWLRLYV